MESSEVNRNISLEGGLTCKKRSERIWPLVINDWKAQGKLFNRSETGKKYGINRKTVSCIIRKFKERGEIKRLGGGGRKATQSTPENMKRVQEILERNPTLSLTQIAKELNLHRYTVFKIKKKLQNGALTKGQQVGENLPSQSLPLASTLSSVIGDNDNDNGCDWEGEDDDDQGDHQGNENRAPCFICDAVDKNVLDATFPSEWVSTTSTVPVEVGRSAGVIWFLKDVMRMRNGELANLMREAGGRNPDAWEISVCTDPSCGGAVERSLALWKEIKRLEEEMRKGWKEILERIRNCSFEKVGESGRNCEDDRVLVNERALEVVRRGTQEVVKMAFPEEDDMSEPQIKMEPENEYDLDDSYGFDDRSNDNEWDLDLEVKVEAGDEDDSRGFRRSSRMKRKTNMFDVHSVSSGAKTKNKSKLKGVKPGKGSSKVCAKSDEKMYSCQSCPSFGNMGKDQFIAHVAFHSKNPKKCSQCCTYFEDNSYKEVQKHWTERHPDSHLADSPKVIPVPAVEITGKLWLCSKPKCKATFGSSEGRDGHELEAHGIRDSIKATFNCSLCPSKFYNVTEVRLHKALEHPEEAALSCCYCDSPQFQIDSKKDGVKFLNLDQLKEHISEEHPDRAYVNSLDGSQTSNVQFLQTCPLCGLVFCSVFYTKLDDHIARDHGRGIYETYRCPLCSKQMRFGEAWKHTIARHWPDAPRKYMCQFCGKGFRSLKDQRVHELIHKNKESRPYQCELCGASFAVRNYLYIHRRVTHQRRPFTSSLLKKQAQKTIEAEGRPNNCDKSLKANE